MITTHPNYHRAMAVLTLLTFVVYLAMQARAL